jgi:hypothetical protein
MQCFEPWYGFDLDDHDTSHNQVDPLTRNPPVPVFDLYRFFTLESETSRFKLEAESDFIDSLAKTWTQTSVHGNSAVDRFADDLFVRRREWCRDSEHVFEPFWSI